MNIENIKYTSKFILPAALITLLVLITQSSLFLEQASLLSTTITLDLLITIPVIYFLLIRKTKISKASVFLLTALGLFICLKIIPREHQSVLPLLKTFLVPVVEIAFVTYIIVNFRKARRNYKRTKERSLDFYTTIKNIASDILPTSIATILATEIGTIYYGLFSWRKKRLTKNEFSLYKKNTSVSIFLGIILILFVEAIVVHAMVGDRSSNIWIITALSVYSILQLLGFLKSLIKRPITFSEDEIQLRYGIMKETTIKLNNISSIELSSKDTIKNKKLRRLSLFGSIENHNVILYLKEKETLHSLYGIKQRYEAIGVYVDEPQLFFDKTCLEAEKHNSK